MKLGGDLAARLGVGLLIGGLAFVLLRQIKGAAADTAANLANAVNPLNPSNVFYSGINAAGANISGSPDWSLGGWLYDVTHSGNGIVIAAPDGLHRVTAGDPLQSSP